MNAQYIIGATCALFAIATASPAAAHDPADVVTPHFEHAISNIPGKTLTATIVDYPPGGVSAPHRHADSAFIFAYVISGEITSKVNDGPTQTFRAGESWYEPPASDHSVSRNASKTEPARLLAIVVHDSADRNITIPYGQTQQGARK